MKISKMSNEEILKKLRIETKRYHCFFKCEHIVKDILGDYGLNYETIISDVAANNANLFLEEANKRNLELDMSIYVYKPIIDFDVIMGILDYCKMRTKNEKELVIINKVMDDLTDHGYAYICNRFGSSKKDKRSCL